MEKVFDAYGKYYNLFYTDKQYSLETDYIDNIIKEFAPKTKTILEYGSGTGGHGLLLKDKGYAIMGIERSEEMAKIAMAKGYNCHVGDILDYKMSQTFDACIALFHVVSYINRNTDLINLFSKTRSRLNPNGIFIFDVWFSPAVMFQTPEVRIKKAEDDQVAVTRLAQPVIDNLKNVVTVNYHVFIKNKQNGQCTELSESHPMRHFSIPEIELLAEHTGFSILKTEEFLTKNQPSSNSWGVTFILKANE